MLLALCLLGIHRWNAVMEVAKVGGDVTGWRHATCKGGPYARLLAADHLSRRVQSHGHKDDTAFPTGPSALLEERATITLGGDAAATAAEDWPSDCRFLGPHRRNFSVEELELQDERYRAWKSQQQDAAAAATADSDYVAMCLSVKGAPPAPPSSAPLACLPPCVLQAITRLHCARRVPLRPPTDPPRRCRCRSHTTNTTPPLQTSTATCPSGSNTTWAWASAASTCTTQAAGRPWTRCCGATSRCVGGGRWAGGRGGGRCRLKSWSRLPLTRRAQPCPVRTLAHAPRPTPHAPRPLPHPRPSPHSHPPPPPQAGSVVFRYVDNFTAAAAELQRTNGHRYTPKFKQLIVYSMCLRDYGIKHRFLCACLCPSLVWTRRLPPTLPPPPRPSCHLTPLLPPLFLLPPPFLPVLPAAFTDSDEYLVLTDGGRSLPDLLREYEQYGGVVANWRILGSSASMAG